jgi:small conductance mechanosensitive channel
MQTNWFSVDKIPIDSGSPAWVRLLLVICLTVATHFLVWIVRYGSNMIVAKSSAEKMPIGFVTQKPKFVTLTGLISSGLTFIIYSIALGFVLKIAFGVEPKQFLTTYLATASVIGLAVGFGSQGLVQDVVTGLTLIFSDTLDVGDMIEISGQIGRVERVGLRFTEVTNFLNQQVFLPNRMIGNIARFPRGGVYAYMDVQIPTNGDEKRFASEIYKLAKGAKAQFNAIILSEPEFSEIEIVEGGTLKYLRVQFKIWPGQSAVLETVFRQRLVDALKKLEPAYADWMVAVTYRAILKSRGRSEVVI